MRRVVPLALLLVLALPALALATQVEALTLRELTADADRIVVGTVIAEEAHYDDLDRIVTDSTIRVEDTLYGPSEPTIVVRHIGGVVGDLGLRVAGEEPYAMGDRMLLFLRTFDSGDVGPVFRPVGMSQGEMPIVSRTEGEMILPGAAGVSVVERAPDGRLTPAVPALTAPVQRDELLARVRDLVAEVHR
ncbi:MAG: hypothetical protein U0234_13805 [Sandaracinus sp.]